MTIQVIPLTSANNQKFESRLDIDGNNITLGFFIYWNNSAQYWLMDIINPTTGLNYVVSIPLLPGTNLLKQFSYMKIGSAFIIPNGKASTDSPDQSNLSTEFALIWGDTE